MSQLEIVIRKAGEPDLVRPLPPGRSTVGRAESNEIVLPDIGVSRTHLQLTVSADGSVVAQDLGSGNGTFIRGLRLEGATPVRQGDFVVLDPFSLEIRAARRAPRYTPRSQQYQTAAEARLDVVNGPNLAQGSYLVPVHGLSMGRSEFRDVVLLDPAASRHHCDIVREEGNWVLRDRGSSNGVHLNERRVTHEALAHGDVIRIGNTQVRFVVLSDLNTSQPAPDPAPLPPDPDSYTPQASLPDLEHTDDTTHDPISYQGPPTEPSPSWRRPAPWLAAGASITAAVLAVIAILSLALAITVLVRPRKPSVSLLPIPEPSPPAWTLDPSVPAPTGSVESLFEQGVDAMRRAQAAPALRAFREILVQDPGNRAAERWSFTAGEHLMLDHMKSLMEAERLDRERREATRDGLLAKLPGRAPKKALKEQFRDDPVVLARMGWMPSQVEGRLARDLDAAFKLANEGDHGGALQIFARVLGETQNPALFQRARFGQQAVRRALSAQVAADWRAGVSAELNGKVTEAREAYRRVLAIDRDNPSARARLLKLGTGTEIPAEATP